ncbi:MAG TPA: lysylphosphatidylglycerol synthase transmembrane domain-containing protein [Thermoleophilaceae bacterium]
MEARETVMEPRAAMSHAPAAAAGRINGKRITLVLLGIVVSVFFGWLATRKISLDEVRRSLTDAHYGWVIPSLVLTFVGGWLRAIRWKLLFRDPERVTVTESFGALSIGLMFNNLLPSRAGEVPRLFALRRTTGLSAFEIGTTIITERILDVFVLALAAVALLPLFPNRGWIHLLGVICAGIVAGCVLLAVLVAVFRQRLRSVLLWGLRKLPFLGEERARSIVEGVSAGGRILMRPRRLAVTLALTALAWGAVGLSGWVLFPAFDLHPGAAAPWLILVANSFALTIPSSSAAVGLYEASVQASLVAFGVSHSTALSYALVLHAINFFPIILVGIAASWLMSRSAPHPRLRSSPT